MVCHTLHVFKTKQAWAGQAQWRVLLTGFGRGADFLELWRAWRDDPRRPTALHVAGVEPFPQGAATLVSQLPPALEPLAAELQQQWWGLVPGLHRLVFEGGRVQLSLYVGLPSEGLRELSFTADAVLMDGSAGLDASTPKSVARLCRRGACLQARHMNDALRAGLAQSGFRIEPADAEGLEAVYDPAWTPKGGRPEPSTAPTHAVVIGGGLAGAAAAAALARRGLQVQVLDQAADPASGASALPAGLLAPHLTPDDNLLSRLSRCGLRITLEQARMLLREGSDWQGGGTLEHRVRPKARAIDAEGFAADWSRAASPREKQDALLPEQALAVWHGSAAWIRPSALVRAWLSQPGIEWRGGERVSALRKEDAAWAVLDEAGGVVARAPLVVIAAALGTASLSGGRLWLHPVRGQVTWGLHEPGVVLPKFPINGNGHLRPSVPLPRGQGWMIGSTYGRGETDTAERETEHAANFERLRGLLPMAAQQLEPQFLGERVHAWCGVRCASTDRRPLVGEIEPGLWVSTAMGSRGLTFAAMCGELIAARLHDEPLPLPLSLAAALDVQRQSVASRG